ncbi:MAG: phosphate signaling complex PhoU family protein [Fimbriimonadaceae bacterium]
MLIPEETPQTGVRSSLDLELEQLQSILARMHATVTTMIRMAVRVTLESDQSLAKQVRRLDDEVDVLELEAMNMILVLLMRHAPVAGDLKFLTATLGIVGELEKAGDDAVKLARRSKKTVETFPEEMQHALQEMSEATIQILDDAMVLYTDYSDEHAQRVIDSDSDIDSRYKRARNNLLALIADTPTLTKPLYRCIETFHALEHAADHAVDIAKRMRSVFYQGDQDDAAPQQEETTQQQEAAPEQAPTGDTAT